VFDNKSARHQQILLGHEWLCTARRVEAEADEADRGACSFNHDSFIGRPRRNEADSLVFNISRESERMKLLATRQDEPERGRTDYGGYAVGACSQLLCGAVTICDRSFALVESYRPP
jgi:hypothetical protein